MHVSIEVAPRSLLDDPAEQAVQTDALLALQVPLGHIVITEPVVLQAYPSVQEETHSNNDSAPLSLHVSKVQGVGV